MDESTSETEAQRHIREKYEAVINRLWKKSDDCPICGSNVWNVADLIEAPVRNITVGAQLVYGKKCYVYVPLTCIQCGYTILFHTGVLDVRDSEEIKSKKALRSAAQGGSQ